MEKIEKLRKYCIAKWNGNGKDVFQESIAIALERYGSLDACNLTLLKNLAKEAARNLRIYEFQTSKQNGISIITPRSSQTRERLSEYFATTAISETKEENDRKEEFDEKKKYFLRKINALKQRGYDDKEIISILKPIAQQKQGVLF